MSAMELIVSRLNDPMVRVLLTRPEGKPSPQGNRTPMSGAKGVSEVKKQPISERIGIYNTWRTWA